MWGWYLAHFILGPQDQTGWTTQTSWLWMNKRKWLLHFVTFPEKMWRQVRAEEVGGWICTCPWLLEVTATKGSRIAKNAKAFWEVPDTLTSKKSFHQNNHHLILNISDFLFWMYSSKTMVLNWKCKCSSLPQTYWIRDSGGEAQQSVVTSPPENWRAKGLKNHFFQTVPYTNTPQRRFCVYIYLDLRTYK